MKTPTSWSNNDSKPQTSWANGVTKKSTGWTASTTKVPTRFTVTPKSVDSWAVAHPSQDYFYNDTTMTYNNVNVLYNSLVNNNTANQSLVTRWSAT